MSVTRAPRDIAFRLSERGRPSSEGRRSQATILPSVDARDRARAWLAFNNSSGNRLIARYLANRKAKADGGPGPDVGQPDIDYENDLESAPPDRRLLIFEQ